MLEIGFGMGIASSMIQEELSVARHFIVEANHQVLQRCLAWKNRLSQMCAREDPVSSLRPVGSNAAAAIHCIDGFWEEVMPFLADSSLDAILFDPYPAIVTSEFLRVASRLLKPGGVLTFFLARPHFVPSAARDQDFWKAQQDQLARAGFAAADVPEHLTLRVRDDCGAPQLATCGSTRSRRWGSRRVSASARAVASGNRSERQHHVFSALRFIGLELII